MTRDNNAHQKNGCRFNEVARNRTGLWIDDVTGRVVDSVKSESRTPSARGSDSQPEALVRWPVAIRMGVTSRKKSVDLVDEDHRQSITSNVSPPPLLPPRRVLLLEKRGRR
jgi:hypothetical protein